MGFRPVTFLSHPGFMPALFDPPSGCPQSPASLHEIPKNLPGFGRIPLGQKAVNRPAQSDMGAPDSPKVCTEIVGPAEGPLGQQELPPGGAQGFAGRPFLFLVVGQGLVGFPRQDLDAGEDLIDTFAQCGKGLLMPRDLLLQIGYFHNLTILREPINSVS
jgi:hypothetical protein